MLLVHGQHDPAKVAVDQVAEEQACDGVRICTGPDHGDHVRVQERIQRRRVRVRPVQQRGVEISVPPDLGALEDVALKAADHP